MTTLNGYIEGLGSGADRIVRKTGKEVRLSVFDNIDDVIVFNQAGETTQTTLTGKNKFKLSNTDQTATVDGVTLDYDSDTDVYSFTGTNTNTANHIILTMTTLFACNLKPNTAYTMSKTLSQINTVYITLSYSDGTISHYETMGGTSRTFTTASAVVNPQIRIGIYGASTTIDESFKLQIEEGSSATEYEEYCGGVPSPNPDYPQNINGIGTKRQDGTYRVDIDYYDEREERDGRITASGLAYPLYEGDILDFANGKVIRGMKVVKMSDLTWLYNNTSLSYGFFYRDITDKALNLNVKSNCFINRGNVRTQLSDNELGFFNTSNSINVICIRCDSITSLSDWETWITNHDSVIVYELATPTEEYITITGGDISDIGTAVVEADGILTVKYDKAEMAVRKYSAKPDWQKIGYTDTPQIILDGFNYSKQIYDSWTSAASYASQYRGDKALKFFPEVDFTGATNYSAMFSESGLLSTPPLTIGDGSNTVIDSRWMFQDSPIEKIELTTSDSAQKAQITNIFNGCSNLINAKLTLSASGSMQYAFADCTRLERIEDGLDTADVTSISEAFRNCSSLNYLYELDLSSCTTCYRAFQNCTSLEHAPYINSINTGGNFQQMFWNCSSLKTLPPYNLHTPNNLTNMFQGTGSNLDENSRRNILSMLAACTYSGTKTLAHLGFTASMYSAASWQALPNYNNFVTAGWSIGYS